MHLQASSDTKKGPVSAYILFSNAMRVQLLASAAPPTSTEMMTKVSAPAGQRTAPAVLAQAALAEKMRSAADPLTARASLAL